jgi:predicted ATP-grasp superfamily ATP-dependent carboligase
MYKVLVTDSSERSALAVIRSLGKKGLCVTAADSADFNAGFLSKYAKDRVVYPSPQRSKKRFVDSLLHLVKSENFDLLIPMTDFSMFPILERREEFEKYVKVAAPASEAAFSALDKAKTIKVAQENAIPCPETYAVENFSELILLSKNIKYPVVIKPRMKVFWSNDKAVVLKVTPRNYAYNADDLRAKYEKLTSGLSYFGVPFDFFLIQEFATGNGYGVELLVHNSVVKAVFAHKRLREYPLHGGASTLRVSIRNDNMSNLAVKLLKALKWEGVAMIEFKFNSSTQELNLIEVNGRFWGSLPLSIKAGVDFPYLLYKCVLGEDFDIPKYRQGLTQRWLLPGELLWLYSSVVDERRVFGPFKDFISSFSTSDDVLSLDDLSPTVGEIETTFNSLKSVVKGSSNVFGETKSSYKTHLR